MINNELVVINIVEKKIIKKYTTLYYDDNLIIYKDYNIRKWNNIYDN